MNHNRFLECLGFLMRGLIELDKGNLVAAEKEFHYSLAWAKQVQVEAGPDLFPLALYSMSLLRLRLGRSQESQLFREKAAERLEKGNPSPDTALYHELMANVLVALGEHRRAIPFCQRAIQLPVNEGDPVEMARLLLRAGLCYCRSGMGDHGAVPLRGAVKIFRNCAGDPRLSEALNTLGIALRKSSPAEAEECFKEVAELSMAKGEVDTAAVAWVNLGVLCYDRARYAESLEYYERALEVREKSPNISPQRLAEPLNNMADCYRRMGKFTEAMQSVDRAIALLEQRGGSLLASAYGTRGLIYRDDGRDAEAVEWLQKAYAVNMKIPSPNLQTIAQDLEYEIAALRRLDRLEEAAEAEGRLASVRETMKAIRPVDCDLNSLSTTTQGAVLIEMGSLNRQRGVSQNPNSRTLITQLSEAMAREQVGFVGGEVVIPENTTVILYGEDGEAIFRVVEPILVRERMCEGAIVTIRQGRSHRKVVLPMRNLN